MDVAAAEAFIALALLLAFLHAPISAVYSSASSLAFPTCRCDVNKPLQFVLYMSDDAVRKRLSRWDPNVKAVTLGGGPPAQGGRPARPTPTPRASHA